MIFTRNPYLLRPVCLAGMLLLAFNANASNILIVNGSSTTSETGTTSDITSTLQATCFPDTTADTVTVVDTPPASLTGYDEIWDIRFSNSSPLTAADQAAYSAFLDAGGKMFVMGENLNFMTRNDSILSWVDALGGGTLTFDSDPALDSYITENVDSPYNTTPNSIATLTYNAPGAVTSPGTGQWITENGTYGSAIVWPTGALASAPTGSLSVVFDVNFMDTPPVGNSVFLQNLCEVVKTGGTPPPPPPTRSSATATPIPVGGGLWRWLLVLGVMGFGAFGWRVKKYG